MKPFHTIAIPHDDVLEGKITLDRFAADLWEVFKGRGPEEYRDASLFFKKTYLTKGLENLLKVIENRLKGEGGDPVIQLQTPFGGGKTHALISLYHKVKEWNARCVVIVGTAMDATDTMWSMIEEQLEGRTYRFNTNISPGREDLRSILEKHKPVLILIDEPLAYLEKASAIKVGDSTLAAQTLVFIQEITEVAKTLDNVSIVATLPSSVLEHYSEKSEEMFQRLQKIFGRLEKIYAPVEDHEIASVIRRRLFSKVDNIKDNVEEFIDYVSNEDILPNGMEVSEYRDKFLNSYPFMPEVIEILYKRWGSFPTFQRTRGVLRLLALVINSLKDSDKWYISLADFDLANEEIRKELVKHIGNEYDSIIAADITDTNSGSKKVDDMLGKSYKGLKIGTRTSTTIFLYSFSGGYEKGATVREIKLSATTINNPSNVVVEALEDLRKNLFYLQTQDGKYLFSNQPNINRILVIKMENIDDNRIIEFEEQMLKKNINGKKFKMFIWPKGSSDIPDTKDLKLVILSRRDEEFMRNILDNIGESPRIHRNTIFFLAPLDNKEQFKNIVKKRLAYEDIINDSTLMKNLTEEQKKEINSNRKKIDDEIYEKLRSVYRLVYAPSKDGFKEIDLGIPTYGLKSSIDDEIYEKLRNEDEILDELSPIIIKNVYLSNKEYVNTKNIYESMLNTPGERRVSSRDVLKASISKGVKEGLFGLGELIDDKVVCKAFKEYTDVTFNEYEVLLIDSLCKIEEIEPPSITKIKDSPTQTIQASTLDEIPTTNELKEITLSFEVPLGKISHLMGIMHLLQSKFKNLKISIEATNGSISKEDYENKIKEGLRQLGIELE